MDLIDMNKHYSVEYNWERKDGVWICTNYKVEEVKLSDDEWIGKLDNDELIDLYNDLEYEINLRGLNNG